MYSQLLFLYPDDLYARYGEEMRWVFREELKKAVRHGFREYTAVWRSVLYDTALQLGPTLVNRLGIVSVAVAGAITIAAASVSFSLPRHLPEIGGRCFPQVYASNNMIHLKRTFHSSGTLRNERSRVMAYLSYVPPKTTKH
jgi:hypothetical protein